MRGRDNMYIHIYIYIYIQYFLYLTFLYLAEAVIIMPGQRNHNLNCFNLEASFSGNGQSSKSKFFIASTSLIPKFKIQSSAATAAEVSFFNFASFHYFFNTEIQSSIFGRDRGRILNVVFC